MGTGQLHCYGVRGRLEKFRALDKYLVSLYLGTALAGQTSLCQSTNQEEAIKLSVSFKTEKVVADARCWSQEE